MTSTTDICCIGHITLDKIVTPKMTVYMPGGTSFYFANAISRLPHEGFQLVTAVGESELGAVEKIRGLGVDVKTLPSRKSVYFENIYGENQNERRQRVLAKADPFTVEGLKDVDAKIYHLGSLLADDFSLVVEACGMGCKGGSSHAWQRGFGHLCRRTFPRHSGLSSRTDCRCHRLRRHLYDRLSLYA